MKADRWLPPVGSIHRGGGDHVGISGPRGTAVGGSGDGSHPQQGLGLGLCPEAGTSLVHPKVPGLRLCCRTAWEKPPASSLAPEEAPPAPTLQLSRRGSVWDTVEAGVYGSEVCVREDAKSCRAVKMDQAEGPRQGWFGGRTLSGLAATGVLRSGLGGQREQAVGFVMMKRMASTQSSKRVQGPRLETGLNHASTRCR